jgi:hypothetical protein
VLEDIYPESEEWLQDDHDYLTYVSYFRWIINFLFVGMPWFAISVIMCIVNIVFNIVVNQFWADGNAFLIVNTVYLFI